MQYRIDGTPLPVLVCTLNPGETMITERGSMCWMSAGMRMETKGGGGLGKMLGRAFAGESMFINRYTSEGGVNEIAFASSFPGSIIPVEITPAMPLIVQKSGFLASTEGIEFAVHFQRKLSAGLFGGEGFLLQRLTGQGLAFVEIDGSCHLRTLAPGEVLRVDTGNLAAMDASVRMEVETVKGFTNVLFGGEGLFLTRLTGPGRVWLQSLPAMAVAQALIPFLPKPSN